MVLYENMIMHEAAKACEVADIDLTVKIRHMCLEHGVSWGYGVQGGQAPLPSWDLPLQGESSGTQIWGNPLEGQILTPCPYVPKESIFCHFYSLISCP